MEVKGYGREYRLRIIDKYVLPLADKATPPFHETSLYEDQDEPPIQSFLNVNFTYSASTACFLQRSEFLVCNLCLFSIIQTWEGRTYLK